MGLDGGTLVTRSDILRRSSQKVADRDGSRSTRGGNVGPRNFGAKKDDDPAFTVCSISLEPLNREHGGVLVCEDGHLYNKQHAPNVTGCVPARLSWPASDSATFRCPSSGVEANGTQRFSVIWSCGCVISNKVIKTLLAFSRIVDCPSCGHPYQAEDVVNLKPPGDAVRTAARAPSSRELVIKQDPGQCKALMPYGRHATIALTARLLETKVTSAVGRIALLNAATVAAGQGRKRRRPEGSLEIGRLAAGWERVESESKPGLFYFRNQQLRLTQWEAPS